MSTLTPRLQLKRPDGADAFKRQDFVDNWNLLDAAPGLHICTSTSRPTWAAAHAGRTILETDTKREVLWTGTSWQDPLSAPPVWFLSKAIGQTLSKGASGTYTIGTFKNTRPLTATVIMNLRLACIPINAQVCFGSILIDGVERTLSTGWTDFVQWSDNNAVASYNDYRYLNMIAPVSVQPGTHTVAVRATVGTISTRTVNVNALSAVIIGTNQTGL